MTKLNTLEANKTEWLEAWIIRAIIKKLRLTALTEDSYPEQKLWVEVVCSAVRDLSNDAKSVRRSGWNFINGHAGDIKFVCGLAGLEADYVRRILNCALEYSNRMFDRNLKLSA